MRFLWWLSAALLLAPVAFVSPAHAQQALIVPVCDTVALPANTGYGPLTISPNGVLCSSAAGGTGGAVTITAQPAAPPLLEARQQRTVALVAAAVAADRRAAAAAAADRDMPPCVSCRNPAGGRRWRRFRLMPC